jgi:hypothetical protein
MDQCRTQINRTMTLIAVQVPTFAPKDRDNIPMQDNTTVQIQQEDSVPANAQCTWAQSQILLPGQQVMYANHRILMSNFLSASTNQMRFGECIAQRMIHPRFPTAMPDQVHDSARRVADSAPLLVGGEPIASGNESGSQHSRQRERGEDEKLRRPRSCKNCIQSGNQERIEVAESCPGKAATRTCWWQCQDTLM